MAFQPLDGPSSQDRVSVTTSTVKELKVGASALPERQVVTVQSDGDIWVYFGDGGAAPSAATVSSKGFRQYKNGKDSYEASEKQSIYVVATSGTVNVTFAERA